MNLETKILELYKKEYSSVKTNKIINLLKVVLVDKEVDINKIEKKVPIVRNTIMKYLSEKTPFLQFLTEEEFKDFERKMNAILAEEKEKLRKEEFTLIAKIIDDIFNTRYKVETICANNFFAHNKFKKILDETNYIDENFGIGVRDKVKAQIQKNGNDRMHVPRNMYLVEDRYNIFIAKKDIISLDEFDFRRLSYASDYLCSGANLEYVAAKRETTISAVIRVLSEEKLKEIIKEEHFNNLKRYLEIETLVLRGDLNKKKEVLFDFVETLYEKDLNKQEVMDKYKLPETLFNKYLLELIKLPYFNTEIKNDAKSLLNINEEKKVK